MNSSELTKNWQVFAHEMKSIRGVFPNVSRPKSDYELLDKKIFNNVIECEGWSLIETPRCVPRMFAGGHTISVSTAPTIATCSRETWLTKRRMASCSSL